MNKYENLGKALTMIIIGISLLIGTMLIFTYLDIIIPQTISHAYWVIYRFSLSDEQLSPLHICIIIAWFIEIVFLFLIPVILYELREQKETKQLREEEALSSKLYKITTDAVYRQWDYALRKHVQTEINKCVAIEVKPIFTELVPLRQAIGDLEERLEHLELLHYIGSPADDSEKDGPTTYIGCHSEDADRPVDRSGWSGYSKQIIHDHKED